jgi:hypothetical protein
VEERDKANAGAEAAAPAFRSWASAHQLMYEEWWSLPQATQLLRHGFMQEVRSLAYGTLPGVPGEVRIAHADFATQEHGFDAHWFTVVLIPAPGSLAFATRILCHDRGLSELERSNPDAERQVIELDDQAVRLESDDFLKRFTLAADHDQDNVRTWQLFDPAMVEWLTAEAPPGFSFELQDGALCCFVKGLLTEETDLAALCQGAARVFAKVEEVCAGLASAPADQAAPAAAPGSRDEMVVKELAEHDFDEPPKSVKDAAKAFRHGPLLGDAAWKLGAEAFFREYAAAAGFQPLTIAAFRAIYLDATVSGILEHVAHGHLAGTELDAYLALSNDDTYEDLGWATLFAPVQPGVNSFDFAVDAEAQAVDDDDNWNVMSDGTLVYVYRTDKGRRGRKRADLDELMARAVPLVTRLVQGGPG